MPRRNLLRRRIPTARSLIWSGWLRSLYLETVLRMIPIVFMVSTFCRVSLHLQYKSNRHTFTIGGVLSFFFFFFWTNFHVHRQRLICISSREPPPPRSCGFHNTVAAWLKQRSPDRSITNLHSQQSVTDSMPTKPLAIHYWEAVQGEACPTAAC